MTSSRYYQVLKVGPEASLAEIKAAYHRAAKTNHPDLFPEHQRRHYEMRMMQINAAYLAVICERSESPPRQSSRSESSRSEAPARDASTTELGHLRDPAYTYYKLGFKYFSEGRRTLAKHYLSGGQRIDFSTENVDVLRLAVVALHHFHKAYGCFEKVSTDYAESVWARDSVVKIYYLNRYNAIYQRICDNLSNQISRINSLRAGAAAK